MTFLLNFYNEKNIQEFIFFCNKTKADASDVFAERFFLKYRLEMRKWEAETESLNEI